MLRPGLVAAKLRASACRALIFHVTLCRMTFERFLNAFCPAIAVPAGVSVIARTGASCMGMMMITITTAAP